MYNDGFVVAVILGLLALLSPVVWIAWWLVADLGEKVSGSAAASNETWEERARRAA